MKQNRKSRNRVTNIFDFQQRCQYNSTQRELSFLRNGVRIMVKAYAKRNFDPCLIPHIKMNSKWMIDLI